MDRFPFNALAIAVAPMSPMLLSFNVGKKHVKKNTYYQGP
jgi:hypothetical protein